MLDSLLIIAPIAYFKRKKLNALEELKLRTSPKKLLVNAAIALALLYFFTIALSFALPFLGLNDLDKVSEKVNSLALMSPIIITYLLIVRVIAEEIFFRGFLVQKIGIIASSALFAVAHYAYGSSAEIIGAFVLGTVLAYQFNKSKDLTATIWAHMLYNLINLMFLG